ncbi:NYN domain-containing protein [Helicobacter pylori]|uniref:NYN domain-containing protein n=1 Tax=Helicobacter pylori TaxID=210 RepID=UPI001E28A8F8|nr:NYN domain-containing protein [Helicobacter pylori]
MGKIETMIFVDWENLRSDLKAIQNNPNTDECFKLPHFNFNNPEQLLALIRSFLELEEELKRIYFYVSEPFTEAEPRIKSDKIKKKNLKSIKRIIPKIMRKECVHQGLSNLSTM